VDLAFDHDNISISNNREKYLRIAIVNFTGGGLSGGYSKYLQNTLPLIAEDERVAELEVYMPVGHKDIINSPTITVHSIPASNMHNNKIWLKNELTKRQPDVIYIPSAMWINCAQTSIVTMIQNMEPLVVPFHGNPLKESIKNVGRYIANLQACRKANRVIALSKFVKTYLTEKWRIASDRIGLVYHGIDLINQTSANDHSAIASLEARPFLFTAGSIRPARGLEDIINALSILNTDQPMQLIVGGNVDPGMEPYFCKLKKMANNAGISERVHWTGKLPDSAMAWCFAHCKAFIMTSRTESFGMIAGEAMAHGCLCISSENPCLPEIFGPSALYYPPKDFTILAKQIQSVLSMGEVERVTMSNTAKDIASRFSWEVCAKKTVDELQKALR